MPEPDTVKVEIELPRDKVHILTGEQPEAARIESSQPVSGEDMKIEKFRRQIEAASQGSDNSPPESQEPTADKAKSLLEKAPVNTNDTSPPNPNQKKIIAVGLAIAVLGIVLWPLSNFVIATVVAIVGATAVAAGTFVKV
jgi:hypothetical protein